MTKQSSFEIGARLMGIYFIVMAFQNILAGVIASQMTVETSQKIFVWLFPVIYGMAGIALLIQGGDLSKQFMPDDQAPDESTSSRRVDLFQVGLALLGAYFVVLYLPSTLSHVARFRDDWPGKGLWEMMPLLLVETIGTLMFFQCRRIADYLAATSPRTDGSETGQQVNGEPPVDS